MRVLVTGSHGFLGRHFTAHLRAAGHRVYEVDIANPVKPLDALAHFQCDLTRYDLVLHLAAVSPHRAAIDGKALAVGAGNLALDSAMFEWAARTKPGRVVYFSSSAAYPVSLQGEVYREILHEDCMNAEYLTGGAPDAIYGWVKLMGERLADAYRATGGVVTVLRPFSGYGEDQSADFPFGAFRDRTLAREHPFTIWGDGTQVRDWIHVDDIVGATLAAVEHEIDGPLNLCTGIGTSMRELARMFASAAGYRPRYEYETSAPTGVAYRVGDPTLLNTFYECKVSLEEGIRRALVGQ